MIFRTSEAVPDGTTTMTCMYLLIDFANVAQEVTAYGIRSALMAVAGLSNFGYQLQITWTAPAANIPNISGKDCLPF